MKLNTRLELRISKKTKRALDAAADRNSIKPGTLARIIIEKAVDKKRNAGVSFRP